MNAFPTSPLCTAHLRLKRSPHRNSQTRHRTDAEACGSRLVLEPLNRYEQWWPCTVAQGVEICEAVGSPSIATMADLFHMSIEEADLAEAIHAGGKHIANVHLADSNRILPGYGHTDFGPALKALSDIGYEYYCGFECSIPSGDARAELENLWIISTASCRSNIKSQNLEV